MNESMMSVQEMLPFLIPIVIAEFVLLGITLRHIFTHEHYKRGNRVIWVIVTLIGMQFWGPILYFIFGKEEA